MLFEKVTKIRANGARLGNTSSVNALLQFALIHDSTPEDPIARDHDQLDKVNLGS